MHLDKSQAADLVLEYHRRSKHHLQRYAAGPGTLDWDRQPDPFRHFDSAKQFSLPLRADTLDSTYQQLYTPGEIPPADFTLENLSVFFEISFALSMWKEYAGSRWSLRCNPSSGNLHPTEVYALIMRNIGALVPGVYHYRSDHHALEQRCRFPKSENTDNSSVGFLLGLSTIAWREAWKYGERAFRYCQLDTGHAIACADYAAACLGWQTQQLTHTDSAGIAELLGLSREQDFLHAEPETPELLLSIFPSTSEIPVLEAEFLQAQARQGEWHGRANLLDPQPMYSWPVIDRVSEATEKPVTPQVRYDGIKPLASHPLPDHEIKMSHLIRRRRSAQAYDGQSGMRMQDFFRLLDALLPSAQKPVWHGWPYAARIHPVFFVHQVEGLNPGLYLQVRDPDKLGQLREQLHPQFDWQIPQLTDQSLKLEQLGFYHLVSANARNAARRLACHQDIASHGAFSVALLAEFDLLIKQAPWQYRQLYWEAGMLGQVLYLEAEASELQGTGIGCFFDDATHDILGIRDERWQCLYQFTIGGALQDPRLLQLPPYGNTG